MQHGLENKNNIYGGMRMLEMALMITVIVVVDKNDDVMKKNYLSLNKKFYSNSNP